MVLIPYRLSEMIGLSPQPSFTNLSLGTLTLCAIVALYVWALAAYSFRKTPYEVIEQRTRRGKRILIIVFLGALISSVVGIVSTFPAVADAPPDTKSTVLQHGLDRLHLRETYLTLLAAVVGLAVLRGRASYVKPD